MNRDDYRFRTGAPVSRQPLGQAIDAAHTAAHDITLAIAFDGFSDSRRDDALDEAEAALREALRLIETARQPEPPRVAPDALPTIFEVACDITSKPDGVAA